MSLSSICSLFTKQISAKQLKEIFWVGFGQGVSLLATLLTIKFLTNIINPTVYGYFNLLLVAMVLPSWILFSPLSQPLQRYYAGYKEEGRLNELVWTATISYLWVTLIALIVFNCGVLIGLIRYEGIDVLSLHITSLLFAFEAWISLGTSLASASRDRFRVSMTLTCLAVCRPLFIFLSVSYFGYTLPAIMIGYMASSLTVLGYAVYPIVNIMLQAKPTRFNAVLFRKMLAYGLPFGAWSLFAWLQQYLDRYVVESIVGAGALGSYVAAVQTSSLPFSIAGGLLSTLITPIIFQIAGNGDDQDRLSEATSLLIKLCIVMAGLGGIVVCVYAFFGSQFMQLLTSKSFLAPSSLMAILALSVLITTIAQQLTLVLLANNQSGQLLLVKVIPGLISVPVLWILVSKFKMYGAAIGMLTVSLIYLLLIVYIIRRLNYSKPSPN